jgi:hypothetical protein
LLAEHAVLRLEIIDHLALLLVDPARQATTRNRSGCDSGGMTRRVVQAAHFHDRHDGLFRRRVDSSETLAVSTG